jgi:hypothetical protein
VTIAGLQLFLSHAVMPVAIDNMRRREYNIHVAYRRWTLRAVALVSPDIVLDASNLSVRDPKAHKKISVDNITAELVGRGIYRMAAGAVVSGIAVKDTEPAFSQRLVSIDSICVQLVCLHLLLGQQSLSFLVFYAWGLVHLHGMHAACALYRKTSNLWGTL